MSKLLNTVSIRNVLLRLFFTVFGYILLHTIFGDGQVGRAVTHLFFLEREV